MYCKYCGNELKENMKFCHNCGSRIEIQPSQPHSSSAKRYANRNHRVNPSSMQARPYKQAEPYTPPKADPMSEAYDATVKVTPPTSHIPHTNPTPPMPEESPKKRKPPKRRKRGPAILGCVLAVVVLGLLIFLLINLKKHNWSFSELFKKEPEDVVMENVSIDPSEAILFAENTFVTEENYQSFPLTLRCREDVAVDQIHLVDEGGNALKLNTASEPTGTVCISDYTYADYEATVDLSGFWQNEAIEWKLTALSDEKEVSSFCVNKDYEITDEMTDRLSDVMTDLGEYVETLYETNKKGETIVKDPEKLVDQVEEWLEQNDDILLYHRADAQTVYYVTVDGLASGYALTPVYEEPNQGCAGSGVPSDEKTIKKSHFTYDTSMNATFIDADVLLMCPVREALNNRDGKGTEKAARAVANAYNGHFTLLTDRGEETTASSSVMDTIINREWEEYGTVLLVTHGNSFRRDSDGTSYVFFEMTESKDRENADRKFRNYLNSLQSSYLLPVDSYKISNNMDGWEDASKTKTYASMPDVKLLYIRQDHYFADISNEHLLTDSSYTILITSNFLRAIYSGSTFPHTLFYLGACHSFEDQEFIEFLNQRGASAVIGYDGQIHVNVEESISKHLFDQMLKENEDTIHNTAVRNNNIEEAFDKGIPLIMEGLADASLKYGTLIGEHTASGPSVSGSTSFVYEGYGEMSGRVIDEDGDAVEGATIQVYRYWNKKIQKGKTYATSDKDGNFKIPHVPYGMLVLQAYNKDSEAFINTSLLSPEMKDLTFTLEVNEITVIGCVIDAERDDPIPNALVTVDGKEKRTDADGMFEFTVLKGKDYPMSASADGYKGTSGTLNVGDAKGKKVTLPDIKLNKIKEPEVEPELEEPGPSGPVPVDPVPVDPTPTQPENGNDAEQECQNFIASNLVGTWQNDGGMPVPGRKVFYMNTVEIYSTSDGKNYNLVAAYPYECQKTDYGYYIKIDGSNGTYGYRYEWEYPEALTYMGNGDPYSTDGYSGTSSMSKIF